MRIVSPKQLYVLKVFVYIGIYIGLRTFYPTPHLPVYYHQLCLYFAVIGLKHICYVDLLLSGSCVT